MLDASIVQIHQISNPSNRTSKVPYPLQFFLYRKNSHFKKQLYLTINPWHNWILWFILYILVNPPLSSRLSWWKITASNSFVLRAAKRTDRIFGINFFHTILVVFFSYNRTSFTDGLLSDKNDSESLGNKAWAAM